MLYYIHIFYTDINKNVYKINYQNLFEI